MSTSAKRGLLEASSLLCVLLLHCAAGCASDAPSAEMTSGNPVPDSVVYTSINQVHALLPDPSGGVWAATSGGVLHWDRSFKDIETWTGVNGLPSNDIITLTPVGDQVEAHTASGDCLLTPSVPTAKACQPAESQTVSWDQSEPPPSAPATGAITAQISMSDGRLCASATGFWRFSHGVWREIPLPKGSPASHVSSLACSGADVYAGLYGDGLYRLRDGSWSRIAAPDSCRYVTALAVAGESLIVGTENNGAMACGLRKMSHWIPLPAPATLASADIESITTWHHRPWLATFDHGILTPPGIGVADQGVISYSQIKYPRCLVAVDETLYCRDADSKLYEFDGTDWRPSPLVRALPRPDIYCCSVADGRLYLGGWGGWACVDGGHVENHFTDPCLARQDITSIAADGAAIWIGTQGKGLLRYEKGNYTEYHEAQGVTDDWITAICAQNGRVLVGTYTGGLLELHGDHLTQVLQPEKYAIRAIEIGPDGDAYAATPLGLYVQRFGAAQSDWKLLDPRAYGGAETQCLSMASCGGMWVGGRTSLAWMGSDALQNAEKGILPTSPPPVDAILTDNSHRKQATTIVDSKITP